jgi:hypothetical protein
MRHGGLNTRADIAIQIHSRSHGLAHVQHEKKPDKQERSH